MTVFKDLTTLKTAADSDLGTTDWLMVTQTMIDQFAAATFDRQWIHTDTERAKRESPFGTTIAHGFLTLGLIAHFAEQLLRVESVKMVINYGLNKVRFTGAVPAGTRVRMRASLLSADDFKGQGLLTTLSVVLEAEGQKKPVLVAEWVILQRE